MWSPHPIADANLLCDEVATGIAHPSGAGRAALDHAAHQALCGPPGRLNPRSPTDAEMQKLDPPWAMLGRGSNRVRSAAALQRMCDTGDDPGSPQISGPAEQVPQAGHWIARGLERARGPHAGQDNVKRHLGTGLLVNQG